MRRGVHPALFYSMFVLLLGGNALQGTALLMAPDIARLLGGQNEQIVTAYEDRLAQMRVEIDRLQSRNYAQAGDINLQLQELSAQQEALLEQHQLVRALVTKADELGLAALGGVDEQILYAPTTANGNPDVAATAATVVQMMDETQQAMSDIASAATERTASIVGELSKIGIEVDLPRTALSGVGGPLLAAEGSSDQTSPSLEDANAVMEALLQYKAARDSLALAPVHMPIVGNFRQSSGYGNRKDPFTGGRAFHSGLDFAAPTGTTVLSAGEGVVTFAGLRSGYGKVVEVEHGNGLVTRYAHLSAFLSQKGQKVQTGTPIAKVGSTGRSTGPHLHFEMHRADKSVDPKPFLDTGKRILSMLN
ncbi:murein DD-endopeptidase MepM/ murein hydrolase activator NlpD [Devosia subaequoris]|uniref:Murein DD-endopeptidase MepM/ murein hydrolase activator NlpD n=1 Tax=Devosia subaequoris TaxID=395930 RepID=A0A7W6NA83_9HYPH|nr:murein DD-endopeptidase MepM/ murein hydrolase activator NlpD [Devosia subaequoris]MCP1208651.1 M23 family metallopeptidase [Devosia subaequoris]